ncbi:MAG: aldehyde dehydrogenase family protein [Kofleriaceae bacterium]
MPARSTWCSATWSDRRAGRHPPGGDRGHRLDEGWPAPSRARPRAHLKRLALELGGNAPLLVFDDVDLERAADELMASKFRCAGQTCVAANRSTCSAGGGSVHRAGGRAGARW